MPIDDDIKGEYPDDWEEIRQQVLDRASWNAPPEEDVYLETRPRCERCGKPNGETVTKGPDGAWIDGSWTERPMGPDQPVWRGEDGEVMDRTVTGEQSAETVEVVLTIAHTCQDPRCADRDHLRAWCQFCHIKYDAQPERRARRRKIKSEIRGQMRLFGERGCCGN